MSQATSTAGIVQQLLIDLNLATDPTVGSEWPVYCGYEPDDPDDCITVYDTGSALQGFRQPDGRAVEQPTVQIRVRSAAYLDGWTKARAIADALDALDLRTVSLSESESYLIYAATRTTGILYLGREQRGAARNLFTLNAKVAST